MEQDNQDQNLENSEVIADTNDNSFIYSFIGPHGNMEVKEELFYYWYNHRRMGVKNLYDSLKDKYPENEIPNLNTFRLWIREFVPRGRELDEQVHHQIEATVIAEKVEMLKRHADVGVKMQNLSIKYLEEHADDLTSAGAVRLLVEGIRIERESKGIPEALEKMSKMTDDQLLEEVKKLATSSSVSLEKWDADR